MTVKTHTCNECNLSAFKMISFIKNTGRGHQFDQDTVSFDICLDCLRKAVQKLEE